MNCFLLSRNPGSWHGRLALVGVLASGIWSGVILDQTHQTREGQKLIEKNEIGPLVSEGGENWAGGAGVRAHLDTSTLFSRGTVEERLRSSFARFGNVQSWPLSERVEVEGLLRNYLSQFDSVDEVVGLLGEKGAIFGSHSGVENLVILAAIEHFGKAAVATFGKSGNQSVFLGDWCARLVQKEGLSIIPEIAGILETIPRSSTRRRIVRRLLKVAAARPEFNVDNLEEVEIFWERNFGGGFHKEMELIYAFEVRSEKTNLLVKRFLEGDLEGSEGEMELIKEILLWNPKLLLRAKSNFPEKWFPADDRLFAKAFHGWISADGQASAEWFNQRSEEWRNAFLKTGTERLPAEFAASVLEGFAGGQLKAIPTQIIQGLAGKALEADPLSAIKKIQSLEANGYQLSWDVLLGKLPRKGTLAEKHEIIAAIPNSVVTQGETGVELAKWLAEESPETALMWANENIAAGENRERARQEVLLHWAEDDPRIALQWMEEHGDYLGRNDTNELASHLALWNWKDTLEWAKGLSEDRALAGVLGMLGAGVVPPKQAVVIFDSQIAGWESKDDDMVISAGTVIGQQLGSTDPEAAIEWAIALESEKIRSAALQGIVKEWSKLDPHSVANWLNEGQVVDDGIIGLLVQEIPGDPATAIAWAMTMEDRNRAMGTVVEVLGNHGGEEISEIEGILREAQVSDSERESILSQMLERETE